MAGDTKTLWRNISLLGLPATAAIILILEATFRFLIPASEMPYYYFEEKDQIMKHSTTEQREGLFTAGYWAQQRGRWRINNAGWNSAIDFVQTKSKIRIAIIGDSYVEALQVNVGESLAGQLRMMLPPNVEVYDFGISLAALSQYLQMARYVRLHFDPDIFVINVTHNDFDESLCSVKRQVGMLCLEVEGDDVREASIQPYHPNSMLRILRHSALVRYVALNLKAQTLFQRVLRKRTASEEYNGNVSPEELSHLESHIKRATSYVLERLQLESGNKPVIFIMDALRRDIYSGNLANSNLRWLNEFLLTQCHDRRIDVIDLTEEFSKAFESNHVRFETEYDGHWNEYGHKIVAEKLYASVLPHLKR